MAHRHSPNERTFDPARAARLDDPARLQWLPPGEVVRALRLRDGMTVADIGAGTGYFAIPMARALRSGRVMAVDFQSGMLELLRQKVHEAGARNVEPLHGEARDTNIAAQSCDRLLLANVWHELDERPEVLAEARRILRPEGELAILDWRADVEPPPGPPADHRLSVDSVVAELKGERWDIAGSERIGSFSYIVLATPPPVRNRTSAAC